MFLVGLIYIALSSCCQVYCCRCVKQYSGNELLTYSALGFQLSLTPVLSLSLLTLCTVLIPHLSPLSPPSVQYGGSSQNSTHI